MQTIGGITLATRISKQRISEGFSPYRSASSFRGLESLRAHYPKDQSKRILNLIPFSLSSFRRLDPAFNFFSPLSLLLPHVCFPAS